MQEKTKLYLESSTISMYYQDSAPYLRDLTRQFWESKLPHFSVFISEIVLGEIKATKNDKLREALEALVKDIEVLEITDDVLRLFNIYSTHRRMPPADVLHIAIASVNRINFLVTWNQRHLYKHGTQEIIRGINTKLMIPVPTIITPEDLLDEDN
jgi:predicted nucleic acid-binding protein